MGNIDLTLNSFIVPRMASFSNPPFGTIQPDPGHPGNSTLENVINMMLPLARMRPVAVTEDSTTSEVQADASIVMSGEISSLTLGRGAYRGVELKIFNDAEGDVQILNGTKTVASALGGFLTLRWNGTEWRIKINNLIGDFLEQRPSEKSPVEKCLEGTWLNWTSRAVLYGISAAAPPSYVDYYTLAGTAIAANTTPVVCYHNPGDDYQLYKFKAASAAYTAPAELDPVKWDHLAPDVIDTRESCQKLTVRDQNTREITATDDLQIGDQITGGTYAGKYITEVIVPGGKFESFEGGFRPTFISGGSQRSRIMNIEGGLSLNTSSAGGGSVSFRGDYSRGPFIDSGIPLTDTKLVASSFAYPSPGAILNYALFSARAAVPTGPDNAPVSLSKRLWRLVSLS
jgi:hypothetical protein